MRQYIRPVISVLCIAFTVLAALNVYGDFSQVEAHARDVASPGKPDAAMLTEVSRSPISHRYVFVVKGQPNQIVICKRAAFLIGDYHCQTEN